jgi:hypothetical protein
MKPIQFNLVELMLAIPFAGLFTATVFACLVGGMGRFRLNLLFLQLVLFPLIYLVLLLMVRQHREKGRRVPHENDADAT